MKGFRKFWVFSLLLAVACGAMGLLALARNDAAERTIAGRLTLDEMEKLYGGAAESNKDGCAVYNVEPNPCDNGQDSFCVACFENTDLEQIEACPSTVKEYSDAQITGTVGAPNTETPEDWETPCYRSVSCASADVMENRVCEFVWDGFGFPPFHVICKATPNSAGWYCRQCNWGTATGAWTYEPFQKCIDP
ncbi:MAG: hypothetical protein JW888_14765 [Pirellulales bacterium]|nr:hypothetical protein [Pirellulales bacterium]